MNKQLRWLGIVAIASLFLGFFSSMVDPWASESPLNDEVAAQKIDLIQPVSGASEFAALWRNIHDPVSDPSKGIDAEKDETSKDRAWRLVGVVAIDSQETAYLLTPEDELLALKEGEEFGGDMVVTDIKKKSLSYKNPEQENRELRLYGRVSEVEL